MFTPLAGLELRVTQLFLNFFFFIYRLSDLEGSCSIGTETGHVNLVLACFTPHSPLPTPHSPLPTPERM